jgi:hypothetical protein
MVLLSAIRQWASVRLTRAGPILGTAKRRSRSFAVCAHGGGSLSTRASSILPAVRSRFRRARARRTSFALASARSRCSGEQAGTPAVRRSGCTGPILRVSRARRVRGNPVGSLGGAIPPSRCQHDEPLRFSAQSIRFREGSSIARPVLTDHHVEPLAVRIGERSESGFDECRRADGSMSGRQPCSRSRSTSATDYRNSAPTVELDAFVDA